MKTYTGKAETLGDDIRQAAQEAVAEFGPDALVNFELVEVRGAHGGIAGLHQIEVDIKIRDVDRNQLCKEVSEY